LRAEAGRWRRRVGRRAVAAAWRAGEVVEVLVVVGDEAG
jgi:hypothetical protein